MDCEVVSLFAPDHTYPAGRHGQSSAQALGKVAQTVCIFRTRTVVRVEQGE